MNVHWAINPISSDGSDGSDGVLLPSTPTALKWNRRGVAELPVLCVDMFLIVLGES